MTDISIFWRFWAFKIRVSSSTEGSEGSIDNRLRLLEEVFIGVQEATESLKLSSEALIELPFVLRLNLPGVIIFVSEPALTSRLLKII